MIFKEEFNMGEIQKRTDEIRVNTEEEAKALIEKFKEKIN